MRWVLLVLFFAALPVFADPLPEEAATGPALAGELRNAVPQDTNTISGSLITTGHRHQTQTVPLTCRVVIRDDSWEMIYETSAADGIGAEKLIIIHRVNAPNEYLFARAPSPSAPVPKPEPISPEQAETTALAGSDFSAGDLGLDFLHWPNQVKLKGEMRLGQPCYVLESSNPDGKSIARVKSYIDKETGAPLIAEGFDAGNHMVKEFSLHGSSFKKVNGHWRLENMDIRDKRNRSHTEMKFDILDP